MNRCNAYTLQGKRCKREGWRGNLTCFEHLPDSKGDEEE